MKVKKITDYDKKIEEIVESLKDSVKKAGAKGLVFGLSGGIDSAVIAGLAKRAFKDDSLGIIMPIDSIKEDEIHARLVGENTGIKVEYVDLSKTYHELIKASFDSENKMAKSNIKPRLRMTNLYYYAQSLNYLVCGSSNASEYYVGYFTKHGDSGADIFPIIDILKTDIFEIAKHLNLPKEIIEKKPSAGLWKGQTDEDEMGFTYEELDNYILKGEIADKNKKEKIDRMHKNTSHKRNLDIF